MSTSSILIDGYTPMEIAEMAKRAGLIKAPEPEPEGRTPEEIEKAKAHRKKYRRLWVARDRAEQLQVIIVRRREFFRRIRRHEEHTVAVLHCARSTN